MTIPLAITELIPPARPQVRRQAQANIPNELDARLALKRQTTTYVERVKPAPPLSLAELREHAGAMLDESGGDRTYLEYAAVLLNNALWREHLAAVPYERRLLLLPKCLRNASTCPACFDEFGLLCKHCGQCSLHDLTVEAERLGYAVLIAEGSTLVMRVIETAKIDAIVGVSCLNVLEKAFPYMESAAIPGVAIPLLQDDCRDTNVDLEWIWDVIHLTAEDQTSRLDLDGLRDDVDGWFTPKALEALCGSASTPSQKIAYDWLSRAGKRWRPLLTVCAWRALCDDSDGPVPDDLKRLAIAVECFHKASLIHDDIEDEDPTRYGEPAMHVEHDMPVALNVGDLLIGEGYRLIGELSVRPEQTADMLRVAAANHRDLTLGQGDELCWRQAPAPMSSKQVLEIFRRKTAPAFEAALRLGAIYAGADDKTHEVLRRYSHHLGVAYQVRDDLEDFAGGEGVNDAVATRPTITLALAHELLEGDARAMAESAWRMQLGAAPSQLIRAIEEGGVLERQRELLDAHKFEATRALRELEEATLKGLLRRVMGKIFDDMTMKGWCSERTAPDASSSAVGAA